MSEKLLFFSKKLNIPAKASLWYTLTALLERGSSVIFTPLYTRLLLPSEYGIYPLYIGFVSIFSVFVTLEISGSVIYKGLCEFKEKEKFISASLGLIAFSSLAFASLYFIFSFVFGNPIPLSRELCAVLFLQIFLNGARAVKLSEKRYCYKYGLSIIEGIVFSVGMPILSVAIIYFWNNPATSRIYAQLLLSLLFTLPIILFSLLRGRGRIFDRRVWGFLLKYTLPALPHYAAMAFILQSGKIFAERYFTSDAVGMLSLAISVGFIPSLLTVGAQAALIPWINRKLSEGGIGRKKIYTLVSSALTPLAALTLIFVCFCPEILRIMAPEEYLGALPAIYPISIAVILCFINNIFSSIIAYYKKTYFITLGSGCGALLIFLINILFTKRLGFVFSAIALLPAYLVIFLVFSLLLKKRFCHSELPFLRILLCFSCFFLFSALAYTLAHSLAARLLLASAVFLFLLPRAKKTAAFAL